MISLEPRLPTLTLPRRVSDPRSSAPRLYGAAHREPGARHLLRYFSGAESGLRSGMARHAPRVLLATAAVIGFSAAPAMAASSPLRLVRGLSWHTRGIPFAVATVQTGSAVRVVVAADDLVEIDVDARGRTRGRVLVSSPGDSFDEGFTDVAVGDVDGDGAQDVVALATVKTRPREVPGRAGKPVRLDLATRMVVLHSRGGRLRRGPDMMLPVNASSPRFADLDRDGRPDLVTAATTDDLWGTGGGARLLVLPGLGEGRFGAPQARSGRLPELAGLDVGDLDGDGAVDVVVADGELGVRAFGSGQGHDGQGVQAVPCQLVTGLRLAPLLRPDVLDLLVACSSLGTVDVLRGGASLAPASFIRLAVGPQPVPPAVADLDADGRLDVVLAATGAQDDTSPTGSSGDRLRVALQRRPGRFTTAASLALDDPRALAVADLDGDGRRDIVVVQPARRLVTPVFQGRAPAASGRARARVRIPAQGAEVDPREGTVTIALQCTRGRGDCRGTLDLRGGAVKGAAPFKLRAGHRAHVVVSLTTDRFRVLAVRAVARTPSSRSVARIVLTGPTPADRRAACHPARTTTVVDDGLVRVWRNPGIDSGGYTACRKDLGRILALASSSAGPVATAAGRVAYNFEECDLDTCYGIVRVAEVPTGRVVRDPPVDRNGGLRFAGEIALRRDGTTAWVACRPSDRRCSRRGPRAVVVVGRGGLRELDRGLRIRSGSLRFDARGTLRWTNGGRRRAHVARLAGLSAAATAVAG